MSRILPTGLVFLVLAASSAWAQDYAREKRWADEVVPNVVVGDAVWLKEKQGREFLGLYTAVKGAKRAVLLVHGIGVNPNHGIIGELRVALSDMGYATLSIQMPVQAADAKASDYYPKLFPEAIDRIGAGAAWLAGKGYAHPVLLSHSLGSWMSESYFAATPEAPFAAWVCLGRGGAFGDLANVHVPLLDVHGANDLAPVLRWAAERARALQRIAGSKQIAIPGADHFYTGREQALEDAIHAFIEGLP
jgi:pimeloyl-ACP methyl ester carboxylesterase